MKKTTETIRLLTCDNICNTVEPQLSGHPYLAASNRSPDEGFPNVFTSIKDVRANCFCASLLRTQIRMPRHAWARALSNKINKW